jgi:hypothetical protein
MAISLRLATSSLRITVPGETYPVSLKNPAVLWADERDLQVMMTDGQDDK